jgi:hypothetical protein
LQSKSNESHLWFDGPRSCSARALWLAIPVYLLSAVLIGLMGKKVDF